MRGEVVLNQSPDSSRTALDNLNQKSRKILYTATTFFPFDFFTDTIIVDITKVEVIYREFFWNKTKFPMLIKDLKNVTVSTDLFFGTLTFELTGFEDNPPKIEKLRRGDALKAQKLITGLIAASEEGIDLTNLDPNDIYQRLMALGSHESDT